FIYLISPKRIPAAIVISIIGANIIRVVYTITDIPRLDLFSNLDYFAFGAIPAYLLLCKQAVLPRIERIPVPIKYATLVLTIGCMFAIPTLDLGVLHIFTPLIFSILFIALILFTLPPTNRIYISDSNLISRLGLFTYGLYLFHTVIINFLLRVVGYSTDAEYYIFIIAALCCTIALSFISYYIFEKPFLRLKSLINT